MKTKHKERIGFVILLGLIAFLATGCKPKQIITEKTITKVDSNAVMYWQDLYYKCESKNAILEADLKRTRDEYYNLRTEISKHEINYDTDKPIVPETGKPPVSSETYTQTKSQLEKKINEMETLVQEYKLEVNSQERKISNLNIIVESLREENNLLKEKTTPTTGFNFRLFMRGVVAGIIISVVIYFALKNWKI